MQKISSGLITVIILACSTLTHAAQSSPTEIKQPTSGSRLRLAEPISSHRSHGTPQTKPLQSPRLRKPHSVFRNIRLNNSAPTQTRASKAACNIDAFATSNSATLISQIKSQGVECVNELFNTQPSIQVLAFSSDNMVAVANDVVGLSAAYSGGGDANIESIFLYLRAGYYVSTYNSDVSFHSEVQPAVKLAIDAFLDNSHFYDDDDAHGPTLGEVINTMDSAELQDIYLPVVKQWLSRWNSSYAAKDNMRRAVNSIFSILWRGSQNDNFVTLVGSDTELVSLLAAFSMKNWMLDSDAEYLLSNAAWMLGELKQYTGAAIQANVDTALKAIFETYNMYGYGDSVWLYAASGAAYYGTCADYGICGYVTTLTSLALSQSYTCSDTLKIRSQALTLTQQESACSTLAAEEIYFHTKMQSGNLPITDDNNTQLQTNIFKSDIDYEKYAGHIFDIDTDNGGIYLEGDPSQVDNVPNFIAYEASYANAPHYIWNLEHEYVHYLDGRFNLKGDFAAPTAPTVWWSEGVSEYISKQDQHQQAYDTIHDGSTFDLTTIFATTYENADLDRLYYWGYLAVRFMFERHLSEVLLMREETRAGDWSAYQTRVDNWALDYSEEFTSWTLSMPEPANISPVASFSIECSELVCNFNGDASDDDDGYIETVVWDFGDGQIDDDNDFSLSHTYNNEGTYNVSLTVTDDDGATHTTTQSVTVPTTGNTAPIAELNNVCTDLACDFNGSNSSDSDGSIASYVWDFGDGGAATEMSPSHTYSSAGTYAVTLTVTDNDGATHSVSQSVTVAAAGSTGSGGSFSIALLILLLGCRRKGMN